MTLYLKYRPQQFSDVVGQDHIVTTLENAAKNDRVSHAYLFSGTRGTGKTSIARILAKTILTRGISDEKLAQQIEHEVERGSLVDLIEIDAASTRGIDDIRELIEKIQFAPVVANAKVYIIDEVHMLTKEAFNALLKTLEEPPDYAYFILATTESHKVPDTIQSRCQRFPFRRVKEEDLIRRLQFIVDQERINADRTALRAIAAHATGSFRDAISLLDQLRSLEKITMEDVRERTGDDGERFIPLLFDALTSENLSAIPEIVEQIEEEGIPLDRIVRLLLTTLRQKMREEISNDETRQQYLIMLDVMLGALKDLRVSPVPGLVLETALLSLSGTNEIDAKKEHPKAKVALTKMKESLPVVEEKEEDVERKMEPDEKKPSIIEAPDLTLENVRKSWPSIVSNVSVPSVKMSLKNGSVTRVDGTKIFVHFTSAFHRDRVAQTDAARMVESILEHFFKRSVRMECVIDTTSSTDTTGIKTDLAEAAKEVFGM